MAYDEKLAARIDVAVRGWPGMSTEQLFGTLPAKSSAEKTTPRASTAGAKRAARPAARSTPGQRARQR